MNGFRNLCEFIAAQHDGANDVNSREQGLSGFDFNVSVVSLRVLERRGGYTHYDLKTLSKLIAVRATLVRDYVGI